jgi:NitT/TauT family transport system substrate-binding protein
VRRAAGALGACAESDRPGSRTFLQRSNKRCRPCRLACRLVLLLAVLLSACARPEPHALDRVRMNVSPSIKYAPFMIAKEEGFFADEGIDAEFVSIDQNSGMLAATNGELDVFGGPVRSGLFNAMLRGVPLQIVADKGHFEPLPCAPEAFAAPVEMADRIARNGGSIRGERVALISGGVTEYLIDRLLARQQLTRKDVELAQMPQGDYLSRSTRKMDAIRYMSEPQLSNELHAGTMKIIAGAEEVAPGHQHAVLTFGRRLLRDDPELGRRFMRAWLRGVRQYNEGKTPRNVDIIARYSKLPADSIRRACWIPIAADGQIRDEAMQPVLDWLKSRDYLEGDVPRAMWWNPEFVEAATRP